MERTQIFRLLPLSGGVFPRGLIARRRAALLCGALLIAGGGGVAPALAATEVGAIAGQFSVTPTGQASYTIPIVAPGGVAGLAPQLALTVETGLGVGPAGWDTALSGLSVIRRCASTYAYDGSVAPVSLTSNDRFCLDGQELTLLAGTYGEDGATYTTTPSAHIEVVSHTDNDSLGPQYFDVLHPDGTVWEYGQLDDSEVTATRGGNTVGLAWWLNRIYDPYGNTVSFYYTQSAGVAYLQSVGWGSGRALTFVYASVPADALSYRYVVGNLIERTERLTEIIYQDGGANQVEYYLGYLADGAGSNRNRLASVQECASGSCLPTTTISWQQGSPGYGGATDTGAPGPTDSNSFVADLNGDGREDLVYDRGSELYVRFGQANGGFGSELDTGVSAADAAGAQPIRFQAGAADEVLVENSSGLAILSYSSSSGFSVQTLNVQPGLPVAVADVNGDGLDDLVAYRENPSDPSVDQLIAYLNTGAGSFGAAQVVYTLDPPAAQTQGVAVAAHYRGFRAVGPEAASGPEHALHFTRVNGGIVARYAIAHTQPLGGCQTQCQAQTITTWNFYDQAYVWNGSALATYGPTFDHYQAGFQNTDNPSKIIALDVNGDGLTGLAVANASADTLTLLLNTGYSFVSAAYGSSTGGLTLSAAVAADYDGNGRASLLVPGADGDWMLLDSDGTEFGAPQDTGVDASGFGAQPIVADSGGRMLEDLVGVNGSGIELALRDGPYPDLVANITDGFGNTDALSWQPLSHYGSLNYQPATNFERTFRGLPVVSAYTANDGVGGNYTMSYAYDTPQQVVAAAPDFVGFNTIAASDSRDGEVTTTTWAINQYQTGLPKETQVAQENGDMIRDDSYDYGGVYLHLAEPDQVRSWQTEFYDASGDALYSVARTYSYDHGSDPTYNLTGSTVTTTCAPAAGDCAGESWSSVTALTLANSLTTSDWCNALPSEVDVTHTLPGGDQEERTTTYDPDTTYCREDSVTTNAQAASPDLATTTAFTYDDGSGNVTAVTVSGHGASGAALPARTTQYGYDSGEEFVTQVTDAVGDVTGYGWNTVLGLPSAVTAPNGSVTATHYDAFGRPKETILPGGGTESVSWAPCTDGCGFPAGAWQESETAALASGASAGARQQIYDQYGRVVSSQQLLSGGWAQVNRSYDALGRLEEITAPYYSGDPVYVSTYGYDALGRVTRIATPSPSTAPGAASAVTTVSYTGLTTTATQQSNGATTVTAYDPLGEIASVQDADGNASAYAWGPFGELTQVSGPDSVITTIGYDGAGHRSSVSAPDLGGTVAFQSDSLGEVTQKTDAAGGIINYSYDGLGRLTGESVPGNTNLTRAWDYSEQGNAAGQLYKETQGSSFTRLFSYDPDGNITQDDETLNGAGLWFNYAWDSLGRLTSISYPNTTAAARLRLAYAWDANGALESVTDANSGTVYWQENPDAPVEMQNAWGATQAWTLGSGTAVERSYEGATDALTNVKAGPGGSAALVNLSYGYDALGNVTHTNDAVEGVSRTLTYDALNRYKGVTITNPNVPNGMTRGTYYNGGGNLTSRTLVGSYTYGENAAPPHAVTTITQQGNITHYSYDANGQMTSGAGYASVAWNPYNEPTELEAGADENPPSVWLGYDPDGNLLTKTVYGNAQWRYFGKLFVETGSSYRERIMANGEVVAVMNVNSAGFPSVNYLIHDNLGSTAAVLDASGALEGRYAWDVWGDLMNPATGNGPDPNQSADEALTSLGYTGHEMFWAAGFVHTQMRLYAPAIGRWLSPDPTVPNLDDGQSLNRYSYVLNNPLTFVDPYGYFQVGTFFLGLGKGALAVIGYVGLDSVDVLSGGLLTPVVAVGLLQTSDLATNSIQTVVASFQNAPPPESPLETVVGEIPDQAVKTAVTAILAASNPKDALGEFAMWGAEEGLGFAGSAGQGNYWGAGSSVPVHEVDSTRIPPVGTVTVGPMVSTWTAPNGDTVTCYTTGSGTTCKVSPPTKHK